MSEICNIIHTTDPNKDIDTLPQSMISNEKDDLEDGEIDDSDEEESIVNNNNSATTFVDSKTNEKLTKFIENSSIVTIDLSNDSIASPSTSSLISPPLISSLSPAILTNTNNKSKNNTSMEDDHACSIENALANVLKKRGIEPILPKIMEGRVVLQQYDSDDNLSPSQSGCRENRRRRKRKKQREEKERDKDRERKEKKKRYDLTDITTSIIDNDDVMDEYEMMNVRGGSPPQCLNTSSHLFKTDVGHTDDDASEASSYDSIETDGDESNIDEMHRRRHNRKDLRKRKEPRNRLEERRLEKRQRRESLDEKHRNEPRKLELCKFYLMECCAKRDKCSYMHADFPCKYYYLGMDCTYKDDCKFSHGEPMSEELRNILLKHLETAPKTILGSFKRISREAAIAMVTKRHEELCVQFNVQNVWTPITPSSLPIHHNRRNNNGGNVCMGIGLSGIIGNKTNNICSDITKTGIANNIPSLLDMVIKPPSDNDMESFNEHISSTCTANKNTNQNNNIMSNGTGSTLEKQRKTRWTDNTQSSTLSNITFNIQPPSSTAPSYLDLKNLGGILSSEHIEKLSQLGIVNLEQVNQLTFGQLNQIGLTIAEISEIQLNAMNMAKLGINTSIIGTTGIKIPTTSTEMNTSHVGNTTITNITTLQTNETNTANSNTTNENPSISNSIITPSILTNGNLDISPNSNNQTIKNILTGNTIIGGSLDGNDKELLNSNSNSNCSSSGVATVDYSQYLKDSNLSFDRTDFHDDERDDEQLVIDDDNLEYSKDEYQKNIDIHDVISRKNDDDDDNMEDDDLMRSNISQLGVTMKVLQNPFRTDSPYFGMDDFKSDCNIISSIKGHSEFEGGLLSSKASLLNMNQLRSHSRSRSRTPPARSRSNTPEPPVSSPPLFESMRWESKEIEYERSSMYDYCIRIAEEEATQAAQRSKTDKDMHHLSKTNSGNSLSDIDLRLPFQPITNYTPATEIDGSITSYMPRVYKVFDIEIPRPNYFDLRQHYKSEHTTDPRLRRILGLPELSQTKTSAALSRKIRKSSINSIASPESEDSSPKYYTPPNNTSTSTISTSQQIQHSGDPRRTGGDPRRKSTACIESSYNSSSGSTSTSSTSGQKQNIEIRNLLQKSEWYKNLNSKFKIMVNQQLALVSTELKKFHQDPSPNKVFDIGFIVNNTTLQQILTNLGIYIDDNGEVAYVTDDTESTPVTRKNLIDISPGNDGISNTNININLPNMSQPPPNVGNLSGVVAGSSQNNRNANSPVLDFLRAPPPNIVPAGPPPIAIGSVFQRTPLQVSLFTARPSLLGMPPPPPTRFNPFISGLSDNINFMSGGAPSGSALMGPYGGVGIGIPPLHQQHQRNYHNQRNRNQNRRHNKI